MARTGNNKNGRLVERYFQLISKPDKGYEAVAVQLMNLWQIDGVLEITGMKESTEVYKGQLAIHTAYMDKFSGGKGKPGVKGININHFPHVETRIIRIEEEEEQVNAFWSISIKTSKEEQLNIQGIHSFNFKKGKIKSLSINVSSNRFQLLLKELNYINFSIKELSKFIT